MTYTEFEQFADQIGERRRRVERLAPPLLLALGLASDAGAAGEAPTSAAPVNASVNATSHLLADALTDLGAAEDELRAQNEALFAARMELEREQQVFRDLFDFAPTAYFVTTPSGKITRLNQAALALLARPANMAIGKPLAAYIALPDRTAFRRALARSSASPRTETWRVRFVRRDGESVECRVHMRAVSAPPILGGCDSAEPVLHWVVTEEPWDLGDDLV